MSGQGRHESAAAEALGQGPAAAVGHSVRPEALNSAKPPSTFDGLGAVLRPRQHAPGSVGALNPRHRRLMPPPVPGFSHAPNGSRSTVCRMTDRILEQWWDDLPPTQREKARLLEVGARMPVWMVASLAGVGYIQGAVGGPPAHSFTLSEEVARFVASRPPLSRLLLFGPTDFSIIGTAPKRPGA